MFKDWNEVSPSDDWFPYKYIDDEVEKIIYKTKGQLASDEMENEIRHYVESLDHDLQWVSRITIGINKLLVDREYIDFFMQIYMKWSKDNGVWWRLRSEERGVG